MLFISVASWAGRKNDKSILHVFLANSTFPANTTDILCHKHGINCKDKIVMEKGSIIISPGKICLVFLFNKRRTTGNIYAAALWHLSN